MHTGPTFRASQNPVVHLAPRPSTAPPHPSTAAAHRPSIEPEPMDATEGEAMDAVVLAVGAFATAGVGAGAGARALLRRLRRGTRIPPPWCEVVVGVAWAATGALWAAGRLPGAWVPAVLGVGWLAVAAGVVDLRHHRLPDALTLPALPAALLLLAPVGPAAVARGTAGAAVAAGVHAAVHLVDRRAVGAGDVKLAAPLGAVLAAAAWPALAAAAVLAALLTAVLGAALAVVLAGVGAVGARGGVPLPAGGGGPARAGPGRSPRPAGRAVPHGPSMLAATWLVAVAALALGAGGG